MPLVKQMPGLVRWEVARGTGAMGPEAATPYMTADMYFENTDAMNKAMTSKQGKAAAKDLMDFAGKHVSLYFAEVVEAEEVN